ncbi:MAG: hypothetical protein K8U57_11655 [Planctomycetes bacterium]|nr:hypothetical protein [Planctomycetota bacterium]
MPNPDLKVYIFGNRTYFTTSASGGRAFWAPDTTGGKTSKYTSAKPATARWTTDGTGTNTTGILFEFVRPRLYTDDMPRWATSGSRRVHDDDVANAKQGKSNFLGIEMSGPFSWMARMLKSAGAKRVYGIRSPKVLFKWSAYDLAKYCDRICLVCQNEESIDEGYETVEFGDDDDDF